MTRLRRTRWPASACALLVAAGCTSHRDSSPSASSVPKPYVEVSCGLSGASTDDLPAIKAAYTARAAATIGGRTAVSVPSRDAAVIRFAGTPDVDAGALCNVEALEVRPLVAPAVPIGCGTAHPCTPAAGRIALPGSETRYDALDPVRRAALGTVLANYRCAPLTTGRTSAPRVACGPGPSGPRSAAYVLGPAVLSPRAIVGAAAMSPGAGGTTGWTVQIRLSRLVAVDLADYTTAHNTHGRTLGVTPGTCGRTTAPCADFVAFVVDGTVVSAPVTVGPIEGATRLDGNFTRTRADSLAAGLTLAGLGVSSTGQSVRTVH